MDLPGTYPVVDAALNALGRLLPPNSQLTVLGAVADLLETEGTTPIEAIDILVGDGVPGVSNLEAACASLGLPVNPTDEEGLGRLHIRTVQASDYPELFAGEEFLECAGVWANGLGLCAPKGAIATVFSLLRGRLDDYNAILMAMGALNLTPSEVTAEIETRLTGERLALARERAVFLSAFPPNSALWFINGPPPLPPEDMGTVLGPALPETDESPLKQRIGVPAKGKRYNPRATSAIGRELLADPVLVLHCFQRGLWSYLAAYARFVRADAAKSLIPHDARAYRTLRAQITNAQCSGSGFLDPEAFWELHDRTGSHPQADL